MSVHMNCLWKYVGRKGQLDHRLMYQIVCGEFIVSEEAMGLFLRIVVFIYVAIESKFTYIPMHSIPKEDLSMREDILLVSVWL